MAGLTKEQKVAKALLAKAIDLSGLTTEAFEALDEQERADWSKSAQAAFGLEAEEKRLVDEAKASGQQGKGAVDDDEPDHAGLIKVAQGDEELHVHPTCLADHIRLGWKEV